MACTDENEELRVTLQGSVGKFVTSFSNDGDVGRYLTTLGPRSRKSPDVISPPEAIVFNLGHLYFNHRRRYAHRLRGPVKGCALFLMMLTVQEGLAERSPVENQIVPTQRDRIRVARTRALRKW